MSILAASPGARLHWMDAVRGTAILLLLIWHASAVPEMYDITMPDWVRALNAFVLPYRMPTLMLLSGMLLSRSLRKPLPQYYAGKFAMIMWPYVVWVIIAKFTFLEVVGLPWYHWRAWYSTSYLWFLFFIGVYYLIAPMLRRLPPWVPIGAAAVIALVLPYESTEQRMAYFAIFFFTGDWLARTPGLLDRLTTRRAGLIFAAPVVLYGVLAVIFTDLVQYRAWGAPISVAGGLLLMSLFAAAPRGGRSRRALEFLGGSSIIFYVSHFPVMAFLSQTPLAALGSPVLALINLVNALAVGYLLVLVKKRIPFVWLFQAPGAITGLVTRLLRAIGAAARAGVRSLREPH